MRHRQLKTMGLAVTLGLVTPAAHAAIILNVATSGLAGEVTPNNASTTIIAPLANPTISLSLGEAGGGGGTMAAFSTTINLGTAGPVSAFLSITAGTLNSAIFGYVDPLDSEGHAASTIGAFSLSLYTLDAAARTNHVDLVLDSVASQSTLIRSALGTEVTGQSILSNGRLDMGGATVLSVASNAQYMPNFSAYNADGLAIIFNEQLLIGPTSALHQLVTTAVRVSFRNFAAGGQTLNGDLRLGQSSVEIADQPVVFAAVPEPASWVQLLGGFALLGMALRRQRRRTLT